MSTAGNLVIDQLLIGIHEDNPIVINGCYFPQKSTPIISNLVVSESLFRRNISEIISIIGPGALFYPNDTVTKYDHSYYVIVWSIDDGDILFLQGPFKSRLSFPSAIAKLDASRRTVWLLVNCEKPNR